MSRIKIGWGMRDITPDAPVSLFGQLYRRYPKYVDTRIYVTALAFEREGEQAVFCSFDTGVTKPELLAAIRERLRGMDCPGLAPDKVLVNATHTHSAPCPMDGVDEIDYDELEPMLPKGSCIEKPDIPPDALDGRACLDYISALAADAIAEAWNRRAPGYVANEFGRAAIAFNRRTVYKDGHALMYGPTDVPDFDRIEGDTDSGLELLYTYDSEKRLTGVVVNSPCPSQVLEHSDFITADYWGRVREQMAELFGEDVRVLALLSSAGDLSPRDLIRVAQPRNRMEDPTVVKNNSGVYRVTDAYLYADEPEKAIEGTKLIARRICSELADREPFARARMTGDPELRHCVTSLDIPLRRVSLFSALRSLLRVAAFFRKKAGKPFSTEDLSVIYPWVGELSRFSQQGKLCAVTDEYHVIRLGDVAFATNPYELFLCYGARIKALSAASQTFVIQLSCGHRGYLPSKTAEKGGHYSAYVASGWAGHAGGDHLVRETLKLIYKLFDREFKDA